MYFETNYLTVRFLMIRNMEITIFYKKYPYADSYSDQQQ